MADEDQRAQIPTIPQPPVTPGIIDDANNVTLSGTERLGNVNVNVLPPVNVLPGTENIVKVEKQPGDQILVEVPTLTSEKKLEIARSPSVPQPAAVQSPIQKEENEVAPPPAEDQKILSIDAARALLKKKKQLIPIGEKNPDSPLFEAGVVVHQDRRTKEIQGKTAQTLPKAA